MSESEINEHPSDDANESDRLSEPKTETPDPTEIDDTIVLDSSDQVMATTAALLSGETDSQAAGTAPSVGQTVDSVDEQPIRYGSPFAVDPDWETPETDSVQEILLDVGPLKYTAMGSVAASALIVFFAAAAAFWFPGGGTLVAGLGVLLAVFGLYSHYRFKALGCLVAHLACFMISYIRALG